MRVKIVYGHTGMDRYIEALVPAKYSDEDILESVNRRDGHTYRIGPTLSITRPDVEKLEANREREKIASLLQFDEINRHPLIQAFLDLYV